MTVLAQVGENASLLSLLLEALECPLEILVLVDDDFRQTEPLLSRERGEESTVHGVDEKSTGAGQPCMLGGQVRPVKALEHVIVEQNTS